MGEFLRNQTDYIILLESLGFIALGILSYIIFQKEKREIVKLPWLLLMAYGFFHGLSEWLEIFTLSFKSSAALLEFFEEGITALSYLFLWEYVRQGASVIYKRKFGLWFYAPVLLLVLFAEITELEYLVQLFGLCSGVLAGLITYKYAKLLPLRKKMLLAFSFIFVTYGLVDGGNYLFSGGYFLFGEVFLSLSLFFISWVYLEQSLNDEVHTQNLVYRGGNRKIIITVLTTLIIIFMAWFGVDKFGQYAEKDLRQNIMMRASTAAAAINPERIKKLSGSLADINNADFVRLRNQLIAIREVNKDSRFVYLFQYRQGKVIFLADGEPDNSKEYSQPGQVYNEASTALIRAFSEGQTFVQGPLKDRWGTWVSGLAPVKDPETNSVVAVLGIDINSEQWRTEIFAHRLFALALIMGLLLLTITLLVVKSLRQHEKYLDLIVNGISDVLLLIKVEPKLRFRIISVNNTFLRYIQVKEEEAIGQYADEFLNKEGVKIQVENYIKAMQTREIIKCEEIAYLNNRRHVFETKIIPFLDDHGKCTHLLITASDITERKQAEKNLQESEDRLRQLVNNAPVGIIVCDNEGNIITTNPTLLKILGSPSAEETRKINVLTFPLMVEAGLSDSIRKCLETGERVVREDYYKTKWGKNIYARLHITPIQNMTGRIIGAQALMEDFTERKMMEEEILKAHKIESIGILAGGIAHDFNNLLTVILGNISLAKMQTDKNEKIYQRLSEIEKATIQSTELTQQLLTFAKGGTPILKTASISELIQETVAFALRGSKVRYEVNIGDDLWPVNIDEGQISQVINNLIINANQAMPDGGVIKVRVENVSLHAGHRVPLEKGNYVRIAIADQGIGIAPEHLSKIFDPYFTTKQKGSGLGLATSYSIIKKHKGYIKVESQLGAGTEFVIYLPASQQEIKPEIVVNEEILTGHGQILIMDDEEIIREVAAKMLGRFGYEVACAAEGAEAIDMYRKAMASEKPFDLVIMDLTVPGGMGGKELISKLAQIDPGVKAIVCSGYSNDPVMAEYRSFGFLGVVAKPYTIEKLSQVVYEVITGMKESASAEDGE